MLSNNVIFYFFFLININNLVQYFLKFIELKSSVFKKFDKKNVFLMSCYDVKERFHNMIFMLIIFIRNMAEFDWQIGKLLTRI
jgi:hypothetical protein